MCERLQPTICVRGCNRMCCRTWARRASSHRRSCGSYLARPGPCGGCGSQARTVVATDQGACNRMCRRLQPCVPEAATVCAGACNRVCRSLQPYVCCPGKLVIITNQSARGKGLLGAADLDAIHEARLCRLQRVAACMECTLQRAWSAHASAA